MRRLIAMLMMSLMLSACGFSTVDVGHRGILTRFGQVEGEALTEGLYFYNPFTESMHHMDVRTLVWSGETEAYTKDVQESKIFFTLNYNLKPQAATVMFKTVGEDWGQKLVGQVVHRETKEVIAQWDAVDLIGHRAEANDAATRKIQAALEGLNVVVTNFAFTDIHFSPNFDKAVEAKVIAQQQAVQEQNRTEQVKQQAAQVVIRAKSEAESMQIRANALTQNAKLVSWEAVQKWDGKLPQYMLSGNTLPFLSVNQDK